MVTKQVVQQQNNRYNNNDVDGIAAHVEGKAPEQPADDQHNHYNIN